MLEKYLSYLVGCGGWMDKWDLTLRVAKSHDALTKGVNCCICWCSLSVTDVSYHWPLFANMAERFILLHNLTFQENRNAHDCFLGGSIEYIVNSWNSYHNNYSADYSKCQRPAQTMILNRFPSPWHKNTTTERLYLCHYQLET